MTRPRFEEIRWYADKLKTASLFWRLLRESDAPKVYSREFIEANKDKIRRLP